MMCGTPEVERDASSSDEAGPNSPTPSENPSAFKPRHHPRQLTAARALEIFKMRPQLTGPGQLRRGAMKHCKAIAPQFGVSAKTVREIWAGRAWTKATRHEWTEAEIAMRTSLVMRGGSSDSSASTDEPNDAVDKEQAPTRQAAPLLGLNNGAVPSLQALLAAAPQHTILQQMQPAAPQVHTSSAAQLLAQFSGFNTAPPHTAWGSGAATQLVPSAHDLESAIRAVQAKILQDQVYHFLQQHQHQHQHQQQHTIEKAVAAAGGGSFRPS